MFVKSIVVSELPESCAECIFSDWHEDEYACIPLGKLMTHDELISAPPSECPLETDEYLEESMEE